MMRNIIFTQGINNYNFRTIDKPNGYEAVLIIILAVIQALDPVIVEDYLCSKWEQNTVLSEIAGCFPGVPYKLHALCYHICSYTKKDSR